MCVIPTEGKERGMKLLIAEDSTVIQSIHCERMKKWGFEFDIASNGEEAVTLAQCNRGKYDLCLMDISMPKMNGIEAARVIRKTVGYFPILALTSEACYEEPAIDAGMDAFMLKSGHHSELLAKIRELSIKWYRVIIQSGILSVFESLPLNGQQACTLRKLAKNNLCKVSFFDNTDHSFTLHRNALEKITHDFTVKDRLLTTFLNRDSETPTLCYLFKESKLLPQIVLSKEDYQIMQSEEDEILFEHNVL
jgi:DNA-binding response OmpR family regulator